jgi:hypothetical protein
MSQHTTARDWEAAGIVTMGGADGAALAVMFFDFRSLSARTRAPFLFIGGGLGFGGSLGGGSGPSPLDVIRNKVPDMYTPIKCLTKFSVDDLDCSSARVTAIGVAGGYGYTSMRISAGIVRQLFSSADVSGWNTGVGISGSTLVGVWKQIGDAVAYGDEIAIGEEGWTGDGEEYESWA